MPLYQCEQCGAREDSAYGNYFEALLERKPPLCSECITGVWHGRFPKLVLPIFEFRTNDEGNLEHIKTGSTDIDAFVDLFENQETLPQAVQDILLDYGDDASFKACKELLKKLEPFGYTFDYGLDACPIGLKKTNP